MEVVTMIDRPLYVDKIMAYADTPFVKILTGVCLLYTSDAADD